MENNFLVKEIKKSNDIQIDAIWAILKYKEISIKRKISCICEVLSLNYDDIQNNLPKNKEGRILDKKTRYMVHDTLIQIS